VENAIKGLFYAYKHLPVGVMLFKKRNLFFINEHLQNVLLLSTLSKDRIIEIIGNRLGIPNPSHGVVHDFLLHNSYFLNQNNIIQIEHRTISDDITIFVFVKISQPLIEAIKNSSQPLGIHPQEKHEISSPLKNSEWKLLTNALGTNFENKKFPSVVLYKGVPLKADSKIISISNEMIEISIEKNQLIATEIGKEWLIGIKQDLMIGGDVASYDLKHERIWLKNLRLISEGFHLRNNIRYTIDKIGYFNLLIKNEKITLPLYDLSEKGVSVQTDDPTILVTLSSAIGKALNAEIIIDDLHLSVEAIPLYIETMDIPGMMKVAFSIAYDSHNETLLHNWTNNEQHNLIKKVRNFIQMISGQTTENPEK
jgi:hypothetical protein